MSYTILNADDQVVSSEIVVSPAWTGNQYTLTRFFTSSIQETGSTGRFFLNVYQTASINQDAVNQFAIAYGNINGSGSYFFNSVAAGYTPTKDIYGQYKALILGDENSRFTFENPFYPTNPTASSDFVVISVARSCYKQSFNPGSLTLRLRNGANYLTFTDNSQVQTTATFINNTQYYTLVSGSQGSVFSSTGTPSGSYGYVFPQMGLVMINCDALQCPVGNGGLNISWNRTPSNTTPPNPFYNFNNRIAFNLISGSTAQAPNFSLQASEVLSSNFIFCRAKNGDYNYTSNPTIIDSEGNLIYNQLIYSPVTYITTVGLYNDSNELLAVAKLSKPLQKDFTKETLVRVKLDY
jgi:hypothetical protein